jgi:hypothetical protein
LFGLIVILLLARSIKALLQKRSFLEVERMMTQEQKRSFLTGPKTAYLKTKRSLFTFEKPSNLQPKANIIDVFVYESKASNAAFFDFLFLPSKIFGIEQKRHY